MKNESPSPTARAKFPVHEKLQKVKRISLSENIAQQIMSLISAGDLKPGQRLPESVSCANTLALGALLYRKQSAVWPWWAFSTSPSVTELPRLKRRKLCGKDF